MSNHDKTRNTPVVFERDGKIYANSRDVAEFFGKVHSNILRDIRALEMASDLKASWFIETALPDAYSRLGNTFDMTRDGFTLLVMGYTGPKAMEFKVRYIQQFSAMEAALKNPMTGFAIPQTMAEALRLAADQSERLAEQTARIAALAPKADICDRISNSDGLFNLTGSAKILHQPPQVFIKRLAIEAWIYRRPGADRWLAYQDKIHRGYLEHKTTVIQRSDGTDKSVDQVMVTPKGIVRLAKLFAVVPEAEEMRQAG